MKNIQTELFHVKSSYRKQLQIIQVYAHTCAHDYEIVKELHEELEDTIDKKSCRCHIKLGDFNANKEVKSTTGNMKCAWSYGIGNRNQIGKRLLEENNLTITL